MERFEEQLRAYYQTMQLSNYKDNPAFIRVRYRVYTAMDRFRRENPNASAVTLKGELHRRIAEEFQPVLFDEIPFFYEMGVKPSDCWGYPIPGLPSCWNFPDRYSNIAEFDPDIHSISAMGCGPNRLGWSFGHCFDTDHHVPGYTKVFRLGIAGILAQIAAEKSHVSPEIASYDFLSAAEKSCQAVLTIARKFSEAADEQLKDCTDETKRTNLTWIRDIARKVPENPPETFLEGLCCLWFIREVMGSLEAVGLSSLGRVDKLLGPLYHADISCGRLNRAQAKRWIEMFLAITHIKFDAENSSWADSSTCIELGGCDEGGTPVFNEVTKLIVEVHEEQKYIIPKLNCRIAETGDDAFVSLLSASILRGHNVYAIFNDRAMIRALTDNGVRLEDARNYVNGGCQETTIEGSYSEGIWFYFSPVRILDQTLQGTEPAVLRTITEKAKQYLPKQLTAPVSFEELYDTVLENIKTAVRCAVDFRLVDGKRWSEIHPCPLFSATLSDCIQNGRDYSAGGGRYNLATVCMTGFGTLVDSLFAIRKAVFEDKVVSFDTLCSVLASDWETDPGLRKVVVDYPKYGHGDTAIDSLAARLVGDLNDYVTTLVNERGGHCVLSFFSYSSIMYFGSYVGATPDGRKKGDYLSLSVSPGRLRAPDCILDEIHSVRALPLAETGGINILDINLPFNRHMTPETIGALVKAFMQTGGHAIQFNYVSRDELVDATVHPEAHRDLIVRLYGLSEYFVNLGSDVQQEFITRNFCDA